MLLIYAYGTNTGVQAVAAGDHGHSEDNLRYVRSRYFTVPACPEVARTIANATFAGRQAGCGARQHRSGVGFDPLHRVRPEHLHRMALALPAGKGAC